MKRIWIVIVCAVIFVCCGENQKEPTAKQDKSTQTKSVDSVAKSVQDRPETIDYNDSFEIFTESRSIDITKPELSKIELQFDLPTKIKSIALKITYKSSTIWSTTATLPQPFQSKIFEIDVTDMKTAENIKLPACYTITGISDLGTKASRDVQIVDKGIFQQTITRGSVEKSDVDKFIGEYRKNYKTTQYFVDDMKLSILNTINQLQIFTFDKDLSQAYGKVAFSNTFNCDFEGFTFINKCFLKYNYEKQIEFVDLFFFLKDDNYYVVPVFEPFSGYLEGNLPDTPKLVNADDGTISREKPAFVKPEKIMKKVSEDDKEIVFAFEDIMHVYSKSLKFFTKVYQVNKSGQQ